MSGLLAFQAVSSFVVRGCPVPLGYLAAPLAPMNEMPAEPLPLVGLTKTASRHFQMCPGGKLAQGEDHQFRVWSRM